MGVVYYKQNKNILEPHLSWDEMRLVYVSFNDRQETLTPTAVHCHEKNLELQYICGGRGNLRIGSRLYEVQEGDLLVYNQGGTLVLQLWRDGTESTGKAGGRAHCP